MSTISPELDAYIQVLLTTVLSKFNDLCAENGSLKAMITDLKKTNDLVLQEVNNLKQVLAGNVGGIKVPVNAEQINSQGKVKDKVLDPKYNVNNGSLKPVAVDNSASTGGGQSSLPIHMSGDKSCDSSEVSSQDIPGSYASAAMQPGAWNRGKVDIEKDKKIQYRDKQAAKKVQSESQKNIHPILCGVRKERTEDLYLSNIYKNSNDSDDQIIKMVKAYAAGED